MQNKSSSNETTKRKVGKLPAKLTPVVFAFYMSSIMALLMCFIITAVHQGINRQLIPEAFIAYKVAMPAAFICVLMVRPVVMALVKRTVSIGH